jgi:hypothetical protein
MSSSLAALAALPFITRPDPALGRTSHGSFSVGVKIVNRLRTERTSPGSQPTLRMIELGQLFVNSAR